MPSDHDGERDAHGCVPGGPVRLLDAQAGPRTSGAVTHWAGATITDNWRTNEGRPDTHRRANDNAWAASTGRASRFFPVFYPDAPDEGEGPRMAGQGSLRADVLLGDARDVLATLDDASVDSVVTDPPYALTSSKNSTKGFMSARWDTGQVAHNPAFWAEVRRVCKPGAFLLAFGGCRTYHRLVCAIEDGGWQPREMLNWVFATGFPKSKSCLKPSHEPIVLAKAPGPLQPLQIDAARVATGEIGAPRAYEPRQDREQWRITGGSTGSGATSSAGRWPPNLLLSHHPDCQPAGVRRVRDANARACKKPADRAKFERTYSPMRGDGAGWSVGAAGYETVDAWTCVDGCPIKALDAQAGPRPVGGPRATYSTAGHAGLYGQGGRSLVGYADTGGPSRFFPTFGPDPADAVPLRYVPKAPPSERRLADGTPTGHPTQKPVALACWLASLICQPGGTILDPFAGVGSLGLGALRAGCHYLGIEQDAGYAAVAQRRLDEEQEQHAGPLFAGVGTAGAAR